MPETRALGTFTSPKRPQLVTSRILEFDGLRAVAILLVIGSHYPGFASHAFHLPEFGWIGVDIFFALSGYLITTILLGLRGRQTPYKTFYGRRMVRILPPYLAATAFLLLVAFREHWNVPKFLISQLLFLQAFPGAGRDVCIALLRHPWYHLRHLPSLLKNARSLKPGSVGLPIQYRFATTPYWSLSVEEYFYLLWAPIMLRFSRRAILWIAVVVCLAEMLFRWMIGDFVAYLFLPCRMDSLLYGALLAILLAHWKESGTPTWARSFFVSLGLLGCSGVALILYAIHPILGEEIRLSPLCLVFGLPLFSITVIAVMGLLLIYTGTEIWPARILRGKVLVFIGTISYTMYLVHVIAGSLVSSVLRLANWSLSDTAKAIASLSITILIAYASWHWLEKPMLRWKDRRFPNVPHPSEPTLG